MVEKTEIDQMAKFMAAMGKTGLDYGTASPTPSYSQDDAGRLIYGDDTPSYVPSTTVARAPVMVADGDVAEMKLILERFHSVAGSVIAEAPSDRNLRDALAMELTETGVKYGGWEIVTKKNGKRSLYDVIHTESNEKIACDLMLYEAALGLARHLNDDGFINSKKLLEMLRAEQEYAGAVNDMIIYRHHLAKSPNSPRRTIYETRYGVAKRKAVAARDQVYSLSERL